ncbi:MAG TPA: response regulator transcription factor [Solirubrobacteraceae bacterium]|jgi:DNA-binding response OmpR family regulator|nr:response regulator transcription factor [Solirubrobacteraceae bacterium]
MSAPAEARQVRIALVDDDSGLATILQRRFEALRWECEVMAYPPTPDQLAAMRLHAMLLNPELSGLDYIERVSGAVSALAILAICRPVQVADRVRALRTGADDWITKPCHPEELIARIQAVMRRRRIGEVSLEDSPTTAGELTIRPDQFDAYVGDEPAGLSCKEYELLRQLSSAEGRVLEREVIYQRVWGYAMVRGDRSVDVFVRKLRNKLERISPEWRYVHTHFGVGYRFAAERDDSARGDEGAPDPPGDRPAKPDVRLDLTASR